MDVQSTLQQWLNELVRGDLENLRPLLPPLPPAGGMLFGDAWSVRRLIEVPKFWPDESAGPASAMCSLVQAIPQTLDRFSFAILGSMEEIQVLFAAQSSLASLIEAFLPGSKHTSFQPRIPCQLPHGLWITGPPRISLANRGAHPAIERLEPFLRVFAGHHPFLYQVQAAKVALADVQRLESQIQAKQRRVHHLADLRGSSSRRLQTELNLLQDGYDHQRLRCLEGSRSGLWKVGITLHLANLDHVGAAGGALVAGMGNGEELRAEEPLRMLSAGDGPVPVFSPLTSAELAALIQVPGQSFSGYRISENVRFDPPTPIEGVPSRLLPLGIDLRTGHQISTPLDDLTRHLLITGLPGTGKTTTCLNLLLTLDRLHIPWLVIEPAKSEYRQLLKLEQPVNVYTAGDERGVPLRLNPFEVPAGLSVSEHIGKLMEIFRSAFVLFPPMPELLRKALELTYVSLGYDLTTGYNPRSLGGSGRTRWPTLDDLMTSVRRIVQQSSYQGELRSNVLAALLTRIDSLRAPGGLGPMLNTRDSIDFEELFEGRTVIELEAVSGSDEKAFVMALLLSRLQTHARIRGQSPTLCRLVLIEEAHRLLRNSGVPYGSDVSANPSAEVTTAFAQIVQELRASGTGVVIAEQNPTDLHHAAIAVTGGTIIHRLLSETDRSALAAKLGLDEHRKRAIGELMIGEAVVQMPGIVGIPRLKMAGPPPGLDGAVPSRDQLRAVAARRRPLPSVDPSSQLPHSVLTAMRDPDSRLNVSFRTLFTAMRLPSSTCSGPDSAYLRDARQRFIRSILQLNPHLDGAGLSLVFQLLLEREVEERGAAAGWTFDQVDELVELGRMAFACDSRVSTTSAALGQQDHSTFAQQLDALHSSAGQTARPFLACVACRHPCAHRYDTSRFDLQSTEMPSLVRRQDSHGLLHAAGSLVSVLYPNAPFRMQAGSAWCLIARCLDEQNLPLPEEQGWINVLAAKLDRMEACS